MKKSATYFLVALFFVSLSLSAQTNKKVDVRSIQGGMWIPSLLKGMNENEMKLLGSKLSAEDIYSVNKSSLKDAIVHFGNGCTSEMISAKGLLLTNHHCGYGRIQSHSTVEHDYLKDGFWAKSLADEIPNEGLTATFIKRIDDVTDAVFEGVSDDMGEAAKQSLISKNINKVTKAAQKEAWQKANVKSFYKGNQYLLFVTETFEDVRLVGAPPSSIGKFGSDTDNWMWPRHTADFSIFRIYADANNRPAKYAKNNVPYTPKRYLPISLDGVEEGDFTLVFGFPGRTNEYLPAVAVDQIVNKLNPAKIKIRENALKIVNGFMRKDPALKIKYASKYAGIANYWKKWKGENQGIHRSGAIAIKKKAEKEFSKIVETKDLAGYKSLLSDFEKVYKDIEEVALARDYWIEVAYRNVETLNALFNAYQLEMAYNRGGEAFYNKVKPTVIERFEKLYKNYSAEVDKPVFEKLVAMYAKNVPSKYIPQNMKGANFSAITTEIFANSAFTNLDKATKILEGNPEEVIKNLANDSGYKFGKELHKMFFEQINPTFQQKNMPIVGLQKKYMKALMEVFPNKRFAPDANSTLRVNYGRVEGYEPKDGISYLPVSYLKGVMEKYKPGDYEFDVPKKLRDLYATKDFGIYGKNDKMPVNVLTTNHMTGGNSGSPVLDAHGNMIGLAFDTTWEGTMSDLHFDADIVRSIMVDVRYVLFIMDKYAGADRLIKELKLVHPKK